MVGLYIHIPFCRSKCAYCDFYSINRGASACDDYISAVIAEWHLRRHEVDEISTIYIGGGTPSLLSDEEFTRLAEAITIDNRPIEFTIEANPDDVTLDKAKMWKSLGVDRVSMGIQTFDNDMLRLINRRHNAETAIEAYHTLRNAGFANISLDLIYGLPGQTEDTWLESVEKMVQLRPEHISAYILSYEPRTRLSALLRAGKIEAASDTLIEKMYRSLIRALSQAGYVHYEISNFALPGYRAVHNSNYWNFSPYLGLGPAAHSFDGTTRRVNPPDLTTYRTKVLGGEPAYEIDEESADNRFNDLLFTSLRTIDGLNFVDVPRRRRLKLLTDAYPFIESGKIRLADGRFTIPEDNWLISDSIISDLMQV